MVCSGDLSKSSELFCFIRQYRIFYLLYTINKINLFFSFSMTPRYNPFGEGGLALKLVVFNSFLFII